jgi:hypothetical protein
MKHLNKTLKGAWVALVTLLFAGAFSFTAQAQFMQDACLPDCTNDQFMGPFQITLEICPGEFYEVEYGYRIACGIWFDYYIGNSITPALGTGTTNTDFYNCVTSLGGYNGFLREVTEKLIIANPAAFPPNSPGDCATNWRVLKGSCWRGVIDFGDPGAGGVAQSFSSGPTFIDIIQPCVTNDCCLERFTVCMDQSGNSSVTNTGYLPPQFPTCNGQNDPWSIGTIFECTPVCGSIYN